MRLHSQTLVQQGAELSEPAQVKSRRAAKHNLRARERAEAESAQIIIDRIAGLLGQLTEDDRQSLLRAAEQMSTT